MKGQLSLEFMIVFVGLLLIVGSITYPLYETSRNKAERLNTLAEARKAATLLATALNSVYAGGPGSRQTVEFWLPRGVVNIEMNTLNDGVVTSDGAVQPNGRIDVQVFFDFNGDENWDNTRDSVVIVETLLPSAWDENGNERSSSWLTENAIQIIRDENFIYDSIHRTKHRVTLEYQIRYYENVLVDWTPIEDRWGVDFKFRAIVNGIQLRVLAENLIWNDWVWAKFGNKWDMDTGNTFTITLTENGTTVAIEVENGQIRITYAPVLPPWYRCISITDEILERA